MVAKPLVIDLFSGDDVADPIDTVGFPQAKRYGIFGCIHKASEGLTLVDRRYDARRKAWMSGGTLSVPDGNGGTIVTPPKWGAYHFFHGEAPVSEADHFLAAADPDKDTDLYLDWEAVGGSGHQPSAASARAFLERIADKLGRKPGIYSGNVAKEQIKGKDAFFGSHRLWLASYGTKWSVQASWDYPWLWQDDGDNYGPGPHTIPGIHGYCDNSTITGPMTIARLTAEWAS